MKQAIKNIIQVVDAVFTYRSHDVNLPDVEALSKSSINIVEGEFVVVLGRNGSGKSTLARLMNAILTPDEGYVYINGMDTANNEKIWEIRRTAGMVFQNPDNQIVGTIVEEDVAFGPENLGLEPSVIRIRVDEALKMVGMTEYSKRAPHLLSGGQKQRVAIAGILAMKPKCIILDEATAMLDPIGRREVMNVLRKLNKNENITILHITHHMDEAVNADRVLVMDKGQIIMDGKPVEIFSQVQKIKEIGLDVPQVAELFFSLRKQGFDLPSDILTVDKAVEFLKSRKDKLNPK